MSRDLIAYATDDISALAKSLRAQLTARAGLPGHVEMLNMLARAAGHRNFQHFRAQAGQMPTARMPTPRTRQEPLDEDGQARILRAAGYFDAQGRLKSWPARTSLQNLCLWALWSKIPAGEPFDERGISALLGSLHLFGDHAILRRTMCELGMMSRSSDGRDYRRIERAPSPEGAALIRHLRERG